MSTESGRSVITRPMQETSTKWYALFVAALIGVGIFVVAWSYQLWHGLTVTGLSDWGSAGGVTWGLYIGAFIWWVGIAHGGIILSAAVRLFGMERYQPVARMAELLTIGALSMAGLLILVHLGRPDRVVTSVVFAWPTTVNNSPLVWDLTVITLYLVLTATYLILTLRYDVHRLRDRLPGFLSPMYNFLLIGYDEEEDPVVERMVWWLALGIIILAPLLLHGGVIPWLFALLPTYPRWYGGVQGPQFLTIALTSAISGVIIAAAIFRRTYGWDDLLSDDVFRGLSHWLTLMVVLFLWLQLQQIITGVWHGTAATDATSHAQLTDPVYWVAIGLVIAGLAYLAAQNLRPSLYSRGRLVVVSFMLLFGTLIEKILFVVEGFFHPQFHIYDAVPGWYVPTPIELAALVGTTSAVVLFFMVISKVVPIIELHAVEEDHGHAGDEEVDA